MFTRDTEKRTDRNKPKSNRKKAGVTMSIVIKTDFILSNVFNLKESPFIMIKGSNYRK